MSTKVGLDLTNDRIRAVTARGWRLRPLETFEIKWNPTVPQDAIALLLQHLGRVDAIAIAVGLGFTHVKHVALPPVSDEERRAMLTLEPDRFFAIEAADVVAATRHDNDLVFAADGQMVESWIAAFETWAPVVCVEPAPSSLARALRSGRPASGKYRLPAGDGEHGIAEIVSGSLTGARRVSEAEAVEGLVAPSSTGKVPAEFVTAYGALLGMDSPVGEMLVSADVARRIARRRWTSLARSVVNVVLALALAMAAIDGSRSRLLDRENEEIALLSPRAEAGAALESRLAQLDLQSSAAQAGRPHADPVAILAALSRRLPKDAQVMSVRSDGDAWQIDGTAKDAGKIVPALDAERLFGDVRFLSGSSRFNEGSRSYETFSVALHARR